MLGLRATRIKRNANRNPPARQIIEPVAVCVEILVDHINMTNAADHLRKLAPAEGFIDDLLDLVSVDLHSEPFHNAPLR